MKNLRGLFSFLIIVLTTVNATALEKSLLWQISGHGLKQPSYLFGTIHIICKKDYVWTPAMQRSLLACNKLCLEMDMDDTAAMTRAAMGMMDYSGKKLSSYFSDADYKRLRRFLIDSAGIDVTSLQFMKPVAIESILTLKITGCADATSYEETLSEIAHKHRQEVVGLETPEEQLDVLNTLPSDSVVTDLLEEINHYTTYRADFHKMLAAYKAQDIDQLQQLITESNGLGMSMDIFLDDRNQRWIARMAEKMNKGSVFFAVGAGHLAGKAGVIEELRKAGYTVTAVMK